LILNISRKDLGQLLIRQWTITIAGINYEKAGLIKPVHYLLNIIIT
jgi:hypothetical protein